MINLETGEITDKFELLFEAVRFDPSLDTLSTLFNSILKENFKDKDFNKSGVYIKEDKNVRKVEAFIKDKFNLSVDLILTRNPNYNASVVYSLDVPMGVSLGNKLKYALGFGPNYNRYLEGDREITSVFNDKEVEKFKDIVNPIIILNTQFIGMEDSKKTGVAKWYDKNYKKLNGRHITALILHEMGHLIYLGEYMRSYSKSARSTFGSNYSLYNLDNPIDLLVAAILIPNTVFMGFLNRKGYSQYNKFEVQADSFAIKYGYGVELAEVLAIGTPKSINFRRKINVILDTILSGRTGPTDDMINHSIYTRILAMYETMIAELENTEDNTSVELKSLKKQKADMEKILGKLNIKEEGR